MAKRTRTRRRTLGNLRWRDDPARSLRMFERLEPRRLLAADWQNFISPLDVNGDTFVSPADVLVGINELNHPTLPENGGQLPDRANHADRPRYDTNGDCVLSPNDLLQIINALNHDRTGPAIEVRLQQDTAPGGTTNHDRVTSNPLITGTVIDLAGVRSFEVRVDGGTFIEVPLELDQTFMFDPGFPLDGTADGVHTIDLRATDGLQQTSEQAGFSLMLDTVAPGAVTTLELLASSDTGASSEDGVTRDNTPTFTVASEAGATVELFANGTSVGSAEAGDPATVTSALVADGLYDFTARAIDVAGNISATSLVKVVTIDTQRPQLDVTSPSNNGVVHRASRLEGTASDPRGVSLRYSIDQLPSQPFVANQAGAFARPLFARQLVDGQHALNVIAEDLAGNIATTSLAIDVQKNAVPFAISDHAPQRGADEVGVRQRVQVFFSRPVDPATLDATNFFASFSGQPLPATIVPASTGDFAWLFFHDALPGSAQVTVNINGDSIQAADGAVLDADGDGVAGGTLAFSFTTGSTAPLAGASLTGLVMDPGPDNRPHTADDLPLAGVDVFLLGLEEVVETTGADGRFTFAAVPAGNVKVEIDGLPAPAPAGVYFPQMVMDAFMQAGQANFVMADMEELFLPRLRQSILQTVDGSQLTTIVADEDAAPDLTPAQRAHLAVTIPPSSLVASDGRSPATAEIGISTVPPELVVDMLPPGVLQHTFDITVQAIGATNFATPAPLTVPNVFGAAPGSQLNFLSFDHSSGRLVIEGTMTVAADGLSATTDPGFGITHPGWHGATPPGTPTTSCTLPATPPVIVAPVPNIDLPEDLFFVTDNGSFELSFENDAAKISLNPFSDACNATNRQATTMVVELTVNRPPQNLQFLSPNLVTQSFQLLPQQSKEIQVDIADLIPLVKNFEQDVLFGANVTVNVYRSDQPSVSLFEDEFNVYRYLDAADDQHDDGVLEFSDTVADGPGNVRRQRKLELRVHPTAAVTPAAGISLADFTVANSGESSDLIFDPVVLEGLGEQSKNLNIFVDKTNTIVGEVLMKGRGVAKTRLFVNKPRLIAEFAKLSTPNDRYAITAVYLNDPSSENVHLDDTYTLSVTGPTSTAVTAPIRFGASAADITAAIEALPLVPAGSVSVRRLAEADTSTDGEPVTSLTVFVEFIGPLNGTALQLGQGTIGGSVTTSTYTLAAMVNDSLISASERRLFDNLEDDLVTPKPAERSDLADALEQALLALFTPFHGGVELTATPPDGTTPAVSYIWDATPGLLYGTSGMPLAPNGNGVDNFDDQTVIASNAAQHSSTVNTFLLAKASNKLPQTDVTVFPGSHLERNRADGTDLGRTAFINAMAYTAAHEAGHTLGLNHTAQAAITPAGNLVVSVNAAGKRLEVKNPALAACASDGCKDIMYGGNLDFVAGSTFQPGLSADLLKLGTKIDWTPAEGMAALSFLTRQRALERHAGRPGFNGVDGRLDHALGAPIPGPQLAIVDSQGSLVLNSLDFGTASLGAASSKTLELMNFGSDPVLLRDLVLEDPTSSFTLFGFTPDTTLLPGDSLFVDIRLTPTASSELNARLVLDSTDPDAVSVISLTGFGLSPDGDLRIELDNNNVGGALLRAPVSFDAFAVLRNIGDSELEITNIEIGARGQTHYSLTGLPTELGDLGPFRFAPGESLDVGLVFDPQQAGLIPGDIVVHSNDPDTPVLSQALVGTGLSGSSPSGTLGEDYVAITDPARPDVPALRDVTDPGGNFSFFMPAERLIHSVLFDPVSGLIAHSFDMTESSGQDSTLPAFVFGASTEHDGDGDGLPRDVELAIGTSDALSDTNGDGLSDFASLRAGIDPLAGFTATTGAISLLPLGHSANDVVVVTSATDPNKTLALVATGDASGGIAIVDVTDRSGPILLAELTLPGVAIEVRVNVGGTMAAVSSGGQTHLVDLSDPTNPRLTRTIDASRATLFDGFAYLVQGTTLISMDVKTGEIRDDRPLANEGSFTDLERLGNLLFAMSGSGRLRIFELSADHNGQITERGEIKVNGTAGRIFVDGNVAYLMTTTGNRRPFVTVDISDLDHPRLLSAEANGLLLPRTEVATNSSTWGYLIGRDPVAPFDQRLSVIDVSDPSIDTPQITTFNLPEQPKGLAIGNGLVFAAVGTDRVNAPGTGGLHILNFPSFDAAGQPPTVTISTPFDDDPSTDGLQLVEGTTIVVVADVFDDVQIRNVELLLDGQVIGNDVNAPFEFDARLMARNEEQGIALQARAFDTGGNSSLSNRLPIELIQDNQPPRITSLEPSDGGFRPEGVVEVRIGFDEDLAAAALDITRFTLRDQAGTPKIPDSVTFAPREAQLVFATLPVGEYTLAIDGANITDPAGNPLATGDVVSTFTVDNGTVFWINPASGQWHDPANWSTRQVPGPADDVVIGVADQIVIDVNRNEPRPRVHRLLSEELVIADGGLVLDGPSELNGGLQSRFGSESGQLTFQAETVLGGKSVIGATFDGTGSVINRGTLTFLDGEVSELHIPFVNQSHVRVDAAAIELGAALTNEGTWEHRALSSVSSRGGEFINHGELIFTSPLAKASYTVPLNNVGQPIQLGSGRELILGGGGTLSNSVVTIDEGGRIEISGGDIVFSNVDISGNGTLATTNGSLTIPEGTSTGVDLAGNTLELGNVGGGIFDVVVEGTLTNAGHAVWHGANLEIGAAGRFLNTGQIQLLARNRNLTGQFDNQGTIEYVGGTLNMNGATLNNRGVWDFQGPNTIVNRPGVNLFNNSATVLVSQDELVQIEVPLHNTAIVDIHRGVLRLSGGGTQTDATIRVAAGARAELAHGDISIFGTTTFEGAGLLENTANDVIVDTDAILLLNMTSDGFTTRATLAHQGLILAGSAINHGNATLSRGAIAAHGSFINEGVTTWTGNGRIQGPGFTNNGLLEYTDDASGTLDEGTITNRGRFHHRSTRALTLHAATIINEAAGVFELLEAGGFTTGFGSPSHHFENGGVFRRAGEAATVTIDIGFENSGTVELASGTTVFADGFAQTAGETSLAGGDLSVNSLQVDLQGGTLRGRGEITGNVTNGGTIQVGGANQSGTLAITHNYLQTATGSLEVELGGTVDGAFDQLVTNTAGGTQSAELGGTLDVFLINGFSAASNDFFPILSFDTAVGDFATTNGTDLPNGLVLQPVVNTNSYSLTALQALRAAELRTTASSPATIDAGAADWLFASLLERLIGDGLSRTVVDPVRRTDIRVADLAGDRLALAGHGLIVLDRDAAGNGWYVDPTPGSDREFTPSRNERIVQARLSNTAAQHIDLLSVLSHEFAHLLGATHDTPFDPLSMTLGPGERELIDADTLAALANRR